MGTKITALLSSIRRQYIGNSLDIDNIPSDPLNLFEEWLKDAIVSKKVLDPNAMCLSTVDQHGHPQSRMILLKEVIGAHSSSSSQKIRQSPKDSNGLYGFIFYTNYQSRKAKQLDKNPHVAITFWWPPLVRQVRVLGRVNKVSSRMSDEYFASRDRGSQLSAVISPQGTVINSYKLLLKEIQAKKKEFSHSDIPRPKQWGGYIINPTKVEFWEGRINRLHYRVLYHKQNTFETNQKGAWIKSQLAP